MWGDVDLGPLDQRTGRVNRGADIVARTLLHHFGPTTMVSNPFGAHTIVLAFADQKLYAIALLTIEARRIRTIHALADPARLAELDAELAAGSGPPSS